MASKSFSAARREAGGEPLTFDIDGETFNVEPQIGAMPIFDLAVAATADTDNAEEMLAATIAFRDFLRSVIVPDDIERFEKTCRSRHVSMDTLGEIVQWIVTEATGHPTKRLSDSLPEPLTSGQTSTPSSSSPDTGTS